MFQLYYIYLCFFFIASFLSIKLSKFFALIYFYFLILYFQDLFLSLNKKTFPIIKAIICWTLGSIIKFSWILFLNKNFIELSLSKLFFGLYLCVFSNLLFEISFVLIYRFFLKKIKLSLFFILLITQQLLLFFNFFVFIGKPTVGLSSNCLILPIVSFFSSQISIGETKPKIINLAKASRLTLGCTTQYEINKILNFLIKTESSNHDPKLYLAPESFFQNINSLSLNLLRETLNQGSLLISGIHFRSQQFLKPSQSVIFIQNKKIKIFQKNLLCPIYEEAFFEEDKIENYKSRTFIFNGEEYFFLICSEFFLSTYSTVWPNSKNIILLVNEKALPLYYYKMLQSYSLIYSWINNKKILWIDYNGLRIINFSDKVLNVIV
jgi:hypothetical protein